MSYMIYRLWMCSEQLCEGEAYEVVPAHHLWFQPYPVVAADHCSSAGFTHLSPVQQNHPSHSLSGWTACKAVLIEQYLVYIVAQEAISTCHAGTSGKCTTQHQTIPLTIPALLPSDEEASMLLAWVDRILWYIVQSIESLPGCVLLTKIASFVSGW